ncbi:hypothetical protein NQF87_08720 [Bombella sp. TMW 2.2559]|uniref:Uncharacterized protein n=2 Tax=Bombella dulcis TaxID=2967339 RepID=A0ABT3WFC6_9PROT|nr:hypothetical protein [Bombella dulcis]
MMVDVMNGLTIREICSGPKRPTMDGFYGWVGRDPKLAEQYTRAREISSDGFEADILALARSTNPENATANKAAFEMLRWAASKRAPRRYGDKQTLEHTGEGGGPVQEIRRIIVRPDHGNDEPSP